MSGIPTVVQMVRCCAICILLGSGACGGSSSPSEPPSNPAPPPSPNPPAALSYDGPASFTVGVPVDPMLPKVTGAVTEYSVEPALPDGITLDPASGEIAGTPTSGKPETLFTITASNADGSADFELLITILLARSFEDRDDLHAGMYQVHAIYAVPADGVDRALDLNGTIEHSLRSSNAFFLNGTGSQVVRYDETLENLIDVSYLGLPNDDAYYAGMGVFARDALEQDVAGAGFDEPKKLYLVYYDGTNADTCGGAPPIGSGDKVAAQYLRAAPAGWIPCDSSPFAGTGTDIAGYWEWGAAHEVVHALGFVDACSPNHFDAHTGDNPADLMYAGDMPWVPTTVDPGQDDYYGANVPGTCSQNLFYSAFLFPQHGNEVPPSVDPPADSGAAATVEIQPD